MSWFRPIHSKLYIGKIQLLGIVCDSWGGTCTWTVNMEMIEGGKYNIPD